MLRYDINLNKYFDIDAKLVANMNRIFIEGIKHVYLLEMGRNI